MNQIFSCPKCKKILEDSAEKLICNQCKKSYSKEEGHVDFLGNADFKVSELSKEKLCKMLQAIKKSGYEKAALQFVNDPLIKPHFLDVKSVDTIFHCLGRNNLRCSHTGNVWCRFDCCLFANIFNRFKGGFACTAARTKCH